MAFEDHETSREAGSTVEIYTLAMGSTIYRMHDSVESVITDSGDDFIRTQIKRGSISTGQEYLELTLPGSHPFSLKFATIAPGQTASLTIQSFHRADPSDVRVIYKGVVRSVAFTQAMSHSALSLIPINEAFNKEIPERTFQSACNNVLFDPDCKVSAGSFTHVGAVSALVSNIVTINGLLAAKGDAWSTGGYISYGVLDYRLVLAQSGDDCTLVLPFHEEVLGKDVSVYAGCDHTIETCLAKFFNDINFGGCPYVPTKNIFITGLK
jgi:uncharacterized phage protein (TIGR02218 family)